MADERDSDRGCQDASEEYRSLLQAHGLEASMSRTGNPYDNAAMESFFSTLKTACLHRLSSPRPAQKPRPSPSTPSKLSTTERASTAHSAISHLWTSRRPTSQQPVLRIPKHCPKNRSKLILDDRPFCRVHVRGVADARSRIFPREKWGAAHGWRRPTRANLSRKGLVVRRRRAAFVSARAWNDWGPAKCRRMKRPFGCPARYSLAPQPGDFCAQRPPPRTLPRWCACLR